MTVLSKAAVALSSLSSLTMPAPALQEHALPDTGLQKTTLYSSGQKESLPYPATIAESQFQWDPTYLGFSVVILALGIIVGRQRNKSTELQNLDRKPFFDRLQNSIPSHFTIFIPNHLFSSPTKRSQSPEIDLSRLEEFAFELSHFNISNRKVSALCKPGAVQERVGMAARFESLPYHEAFRAGWAPFLSEHGLELHLRGDWDSDAQVSFPMHAQFDVLIQDTALAFPVLAKMISDLEDSASTEQRQRLVSVLGKSAYLFICGDQRKGMFSEQLKALLPEFSELAEKLRLLQTGPVHEELARAIELLKSDPEFFKKYCAFNLSLQNTDHGQHYWVSPYQIELAFDDLEFFVTKASFFYVARTTTAYMMSELWSVLGLLREEMETRGRIPTNNEDEAENAGGVAVMEEEIAKVPNVITKEVLERFEKRLRALSQKLKGSNPSASPATAFDSWEGDGPPRINN